MSKLYLYSIFHGNLNYSSIPSEMYEKIIDTCYWPLLDLTKQYNFVTGIEFPFNTIKKIQTLTKLQRGKDFFTLAQALNFRLTP